MVKASVSSWVCVAAFVSMASTVTGCANQPKPLYHWGDYQPEVYAYFKGDGESEDQQLIKLQATAQKAAAKGEVLPPGFDAHMGLLYLKTGRADQARDAFRSEEARFPESKTYMDFLLAKLDSEKKVSAK